MRIVIATISLVAALALVSTAAATQKKTTQINTVLVGDGCDFGTGGNLVCGIAGGGSCICLVGIWNFAGSTNISPLLGAVTFTGDYSDGYFCDGSISSDFVCSEPITYLRTLVLTLITPSGDRLVLDEQYVSMTRPPGGLVSIDDNLVIQGSWTVDPSLSTGRFARYTGWGIYTLGIESHYTGSTFTTALTGSLTFH
jgi:hypothetical protein